MTPLYFLFGDINKNNIYIKRDDLLPISFGGNKARKAVNFFREIDKEDLIVSLRMEVVVPIIVESSQIWLLLENYLVILLLRKNRLCLRLIVR